MSASITFSTGISANGVSINAQSTVTISGETVVLANPDVPPAVEGTLSARTNDTSGTLTMSTGHGITTGQRVDLYWTLSGVDYKCYGATVGTVSGNSVPIASVAGGDALPVANTTIYVGKCVEVPFSFDADTLDAIVWTAGIVGGYIVLNDGTYNLEPKYLAAGSSDYWHTSIGTVNPLAGELPTVAYLSHRDTSYTASDLKVAGLITA